MGFNIIAIGRSEKWERRYEVIFHVYVGGPVLDWSQRSDTAGWCTADLLQRFEGIDCLEHNQQKGR